MIGVGIQQLFIFVFLGYAIGFHQTITQEGVLDGVTKTKAKSLLYSLYACVILITVRTYPPNNGRAED